MNTNHTMVRIDPAVSAEAETFDDFYRRNFTALRSLAGATAGNRSLGEDLAQEALVRAAARWDELRSLDYRDRWVRRVAVNLALSEGRRSARSRRALARLDRPATQEAPAAPLDGKRLRGALDTLSPSQRTAVLLVAVDDATSAEVGRALGCSESMARVHLHRGRQTMQHRLGAASAHRDDG